MCLECDVLRCMTMTRTQHDGACTSARSSPRFDRPCSFQFWVALDGSQYYYFYCYNYYYTYYYYYCCCYYNYYTYYYYYCCYCCYCY